MLRGCKNLGYLRGIFAILFAIMLLSLSFIFELHFDLLFLIFKRQTKNDKQKFSYAESNNLRTFAICVRTHFK